MMATIPTSSIPLPILSSLHSRSPARFTVDLPLSSRRLNSAIAPPKFSGVDIFRPLTSPIVRKSPPMAGILVQNPVTSDLLAAATTGAIALGLLRFWEVTAKRGIEQKLNRKLVHTSVGLVFMLCWPLFSSGWRGAVLAGLIPGVNILKMLLLGLGIMKDDATVKSISRDGSPRELLKGPLYYALTITFATMVYWRTFLLDLQQFVTYVLETIWLTLWEECTGVLNFRSIETSPLLVALQWQFQVFLLQSGTCTISLCSGLSSGARIWF